MISFYGFKAHPGASYADDYQHDDGFCVQELFSDLTGGRDAGRGLPYRPSSLIQAHVLTYS